MIFMNDTSFHITEEYPGYNYMLANIVFVCLFVLNSELRLTEALLEPHVCDRILEYNVHAERKGSLRYAKGQSETMATLHGLV